MNEIKFDVKDFKDDITKLIVKLEKEHPDLYRKSSKEELYDFIQARIDKVSNNNQAELFIMELLAKIGDPHTTIDIGSKSEKIEFKIRKSGLYVINDRVNKNSLYVNKRIISINGKHANQVLKILERYISFDNDSGRRENLEDLLTNIEFLIKYFERENIIFKCEDSTEFDLVQEERKEQVIEKNLLDYKIENDRILFIKYGTCNQKKCSNIGAFIAQIICILQSKDINSVVIDLRGNSGGNSAYIKPLVEELGKKELSKKVALVDNHTFSSGVLAMIDLKQIGFKIQGEIPGLTQNHFGNCKMIELSKNLNIWYSTCEFVIYEGRLIKIIKEKNLPNGMVEITFGRENSITVPKEILECRNNFEIDMVHDEVTMPVEYK